MEREIFIAGIIQGSCCGKEICDQGYRRRLTKLLRDALPEVRVFCPVEEHPNSIDYHPDVARKTFFDLMEHAGRADVLVAFLPQASLGTAIELWQAHRAGKMTFTISPMTENWVVKFISDRNFVCLEEFEQFVREGKFKETIEHHER